MIRELTVGVGSSRTSEVLDLVIGVTKVGRKSRKLETPISDWIDLNS